jgi:hypothetical protein
MLYLLGLFDWIGRDVALSETTAIGIAGWSISSNSRTFNKQTGGGNFGVVEQEHLQLAILLAVFMILLLVQQHFIKNNVLLGTSTTAINTEVEFMVAGDINTVSTIRIKGFIQHHFWRNRDAFNSYIYWIS